MRDLDGLSKCLAFKELAVILGYKQIGNSPDYLSGSRLF